MRERKMLNEARNGREKFYKNHTFNPKNWKEKILISTNKEELNKKENDDRITFDNKLY